MKNKNIILAIIGVIVMGALAFYGGIMYQKTHGSTGARGQFAGRAGGNANFAGRGNLQGSRPISGEIISSDDTSVTVKTMDGSSKIIILSDKTMINKASSGSKDDLKNGEKVTAFGTTNSDGSVTAQNVSIGGMQMFQRTSITPQPTK